MRGFKSSRLGYNEKKQAAGFGEKGITKGFRIKAPEKL